jgi:hypothetical protein
LSSSADSNGILASKNVPKRMPILGGGIVGTQAGREHPHPANTQSLRIQLAAEKQFSSKKYATALTSNARAAATLALSCSRQCP